MCNIWGMSQQHYWEDGLTGRGGTAIPHESERRGGPWAWQTGVTRRTHESLCCLIVNMNEGGDRRRRSGGGHSGAQFNWILKTIEYSIDFSAEFCRHPVKVNRNLNRMFNRVFNIQLN